MIMISLLLLVMLSVSVVQIAGDMDENLARLLLYKYTDSDPVVEGMDFFVNYQIINTGNAAASNIEVSDRYDPNSFETKNNINEEGNVAFELEELAPGGQAVFNVTVRPKLFGIYESTRAKIKYGSGAVEMEGVEPDFRSGYSTSLGRIKIISAAEYERSTSYHLRDFSIFGMIYAIPTFLPFLLWLATKSAIAKISKQKAN
mmetsp:Transcript_9210/g.15294  ORF Transcript_9210/g.15294 Transcript_9210/m.15294 type:complete len:202 (+) Transcript_9210:67-672(+)